MSEGCESVMRRPAQRQSWALNFFKRWTRTAGTCENLMLMGELQARSPFCAAEWSGRLIHCPCFP
jgi:hypothetical protein